MLNYRLKFLPPSEISYNLSPNPIYIHSYAWLVGECQYINRSYSKAYQHFKVKKYLDMLSCIIRNNHVRNALYYEPMLDYECCKYLSGVLKIKNHERVSNHLFEYYKVPFNNSLDVLWLDSIFKRL